MIDGSLLRAMIRTCRFESVFWPVVSVFSGSMIYLYASVHQDGPQAAPALLRQEFQPTQLGETDGAHDLVTNIASRNKRSCNLSAAQSLSRLVNGVGNGKSVLFLECFDQRSRTTKRIQNLFCIVDCPVRAWLPNEGG